MQTKIKYVLMSIPKDFMEEAEISLDRAFQMYVDGGKLIISALTDEECAEGRHGEE